MTCSTKMDVLSISVSPNTFLGSCSSFSRGSSLVQINKTQAALPFKRHLLPRLPPRWMASCGGEAVTLILSLHSRSNMSSNWIIVRREASGLPLLPVPQGGLHWFLAIQGQELVEEE